MKYLSFIEEAVNQDYEGYVGGRVEVWGDGQYAEEEIRFFTDKREEFWEFREVWDFEYVNDWMLKHLRRKIEGEYCNYD